MLAFHSIYFDIAVVTVPSLRCPFSLSPFSTERYYHAPILFVKYFIATSDPCRFSL